MLPRSLLVSLSLVSLLAPSTSRAVFGVGDTGDALLVDLVINTTRQLAQGMEQLNTLRETYEETRRTAALVNEAVQTAKAVRSFNAGAFGEELQNGFRDAFPEIAYYQNEIAGRGNLASRQVGLAQAASYCLADAIADRGACERLRSASDANRYAAMLGVMFGDRRVATATATDAERQDALIDNEIRDVLERIAARQEAFGKLAARIGDLEKQCFGATVANSNADCKDPAQTAAVLTAKMTALRQLNDLDQQRLAQLRALRDESARNAERQAALQRDAALFDDSKKLARDRFEIKTDGALNVDNE